MTTALYNTTLVAEVAISASTASHAQARDTKAVVNNGEAQLQRPVRCASSPHRMFAVVIVVVASAADVHQFGRKLMSEVRDMENGLFDDSPACRRGASQAAWRAGTVLLAASKGTADVSPSAAAASIRFRPPFVPLHGGGSGITCTLATDTHQRSEWPPKTVAVPSVASRGYTNLSTAEVPATASLEKHAGTTFSACASVCPHIPCVAVCVCARARPPVRLQLFVPSATRATAGKRHAHACDHEKKHKGTAPSASCAICLPSSS